MMVFILFHLLLIRSEECSYKTANISDHIRVGYLSIASCESDTVFKSISKNKNLTNIFIFTCINAKHTPIHDAICRFENEVDIVINNLLPQDTYNLFKDRENSDILNIMIPKTNLELLTEWDDKKLFKQWMINHGYENYVPHSIDPNHPIFPFIMKARVSRGASHVYIIHNQEQLNEKVKLLKGVEKDILMEEALTGMGMLEGDIFGATFEGELVSMKCKIATFYSNPHLYTKSTSSDVYLKRGGTYPSFEWASCGMDVVNMMKRVMYISKYTGVFGVTFKMDKNMQIKFYDMNDRLNGDHIEIPEFFIMHFVSLAFRMRSYYSTVKRITEAIPIHPLLSSSMNNQGWYFRQDLIAIANREKEILKKGRDDEHPNSILEVIARLKTHT